MSQEPAPMTGTEEIDLLTDRIVRTIAGLRAHNGQAPEGQILNCVPLTIYEAELLVLAAIKGKESA